MKNPQELKYETRLAEAACRYTHALGVEGAAPKAFTKLKRAARDYANSLRAVKP